MRIFRSRSGALSVLTVWGMIDDTGTAAARGLEADRTARQRLTLSSLPATPAVRVG